MAEQMKSGLLKKGTGIKAKTRCVCVCGGDGGGGVGGGASVAGVVGRQPDV